MRPTITPFCIFFSLLCLATNQSPQESSCRSLDQQVKYTVSVRQSSGAGTTSDCDVVRTHGTTVTILCPGWSPSAVLGLDQKELTSTDLGHSWQPEPPLRPVPYSSVLPSRSLVQSPSDPNIQYRYIPDVGLYLRSEDGGQNWLLPKFRIEGEPRDQFSLRWGTDDFHTAEFHLLAIHPTEPKHIYATVDVEPWTGMILAAGPLAAIQIPGIYHSLNGGEDWEKFCDPPPAATTLAISAVNPQLMYTGGKRGVFKSGDGGKTWSAVGQNALLVERPRMAWEELAESAKEQAGFNFEVSQLVLDPQDPNLIFIVSNKGFYRTVNNGSSWCLLNIGFDILGAYNSLDLNPKRPTEIFLGTSRGVFFSNDRGKHSRRIFPTN